MPEQQSELTQTSQPNTQQEAVSGLLSLLLEQWDDQEVDKAIEHIPEYAGPADIANLGVGLEDLADELAKEDEPRTPPDSYGGEIAIAEKAWESVEPEAHSEIAAKENVDLDAVLSQCFDLIPLDGPPDGEEDEGVHYETLAALEGEVEPVCTEAEIDGLAHAELPFDEPPGDLETWGGSCLSDQIIAEEIEPASGEVLYESNLAFGIFQTAETLPESNEEAPREESSIERPNIIPGEHTWNLASEPPADNSELEPAGEPSLVEKQELSEADLRMLFDSLMRDTGGFDETGDEACSPLVEATLQTSAEPLEIESFDSALAESDDNLLGLLLGGITAIHQTPEFESLAGKETQSLQPQPIVEPPAAKVEPPAPKGPVERFVVFRLGMDSYAVPLQRVVETDRMPRVTFVPGLPASLRGISNLRGDIIPIVDLRHAMGLGETEITVANRLVVVRAAGESSVGLIVDGLAGLGAFWVDRTGRRQAPEETGNKETVNTQLLNGCGEHKGQPVEVLDLDKVLLATELQELAA